MKALSFIINTNIFIALAAVSLTFASQVQLGMNPQFHIYLAVVFFATLADYNFHRLISVNNKPENSQLDKYLWSANNLKMMKFVMILSAAGLIACSFFVKIEIVYLLAPLALLTFLYSIPFFKEKKILFRIKKILGLKITLIALVWSATTVFIPVLQSGNNLSFTEVMLVFTERFTFIIAIAIPFDIRDMKMDEMAGIRTIAVVKGKRTAMHICYLSLLISLVLAILHYSINNMEFIIPAYSVSIASVYFFLNSKKIRNFHFYYHGILDGSIILHGILIVLSYYFLA